MAIYKQLKSGNNERRKVLHPTTIIIFGATGDLAKRKLFPAFYNLYIDGRMPEHFNIVALGRSENTNKISEIMS